MMKTISKYLILILSFCMFNTVQAQDGDAVFNKIVHEYTLNEDGSTEYREYKEVKLLSHMSFHRLYGETFIIFDPEYQEIKINEAYTIMKNGQKVMVPDNAFNEVLPYAASHSGPYNGLRELVITHTGLEVGATVFLDYTIKSKAGYTNTFMGEELIKDIVPIKEKLVIIRIPAGQELHYKVLNLRTSPEISQDKGMEVYTFNFMGLSAYTEEWGTDRELLPRMFFSSAKDLDRAYFSFVSQPAFTYQANADMEAAVKKIKDEKGDGLGAILAIQKMVADETGTWNIPLEYTGFKCRTAEEVWNSNGGTPLEKTILLATLLMKASFHAVPVAIIPDKYYDKQVGSLYIFEGFAVQVRPRGGSEPLYISADHRTSQDLGFGQSGKKFLILDGAIESLKTFDAKVAQAEIINHGNFSVKADGKLSGNLLVQLFGNANPYFSLYLDSSYAKRYAGGATEASLKTLSLTESTFDLKVEKEAAIDQYGDYVFMDIPSSNTGISSWRFSYIERGRQAPIKIRELIHEQYQYMIEIPDAWTLISPAVDIQIDNGIGMLKISLQQDGNRVFVTREIELKKELIQFSEFGDFNELWEAWMNASFKKFIFRKAG